MSEELVSVVIGYRIEWRQPEGRQDAIDLLLRSAGGGGGMGAGSHGAYSARPTGKPRLSPPTLTDAEREAIKRLTPRGDLGMTLTFTLTPAERAVFHGLLQRLG